MRTSSRRTFLCSRSSSWAPTSWVRRPDSAKLACGRQGPEGRAGWAGQGRRAPRAPARTLSSSVEACARTALAGQNFRGVRLRQVACCAFSLSPARQPPAALRARDGCAWGLDARLPRRSGHRVYRPSFEPVGAPSDKVSKSSSRAPRRRLTCELACRPLTGGRDGPLGVTAQGWWEARRCWRGSEMAVSPTVSLTCRLNGM